MINIKDIPHDILVAARKRLGAESDTDESHDETIKHMLPVELMALWSGWQLGDEYWARFIIKQYEFLKTVYINEGDALDTEKHQKRGKEKGGFVSSMKDMQNK